MATRTKLIPLTSGPWAAVLHQVKYVGGWSSFECLFTEEAPGIQPIPEIR